MRKTWRTASIGLALALSFPMIGYGHSGRTDSSGGHKDNKNASGLGSYHYHHGQGPHLHENGVCPYDDVSTETKNTTEYSVSTKSRSRESDVYITTQKNHLYAEADVDTDKLLDVSKGTECEVLETTKYFIKTRIGDQTGYIRKKHARAK